MKRKKQEQVRLSAMIPKADMIQLERLSQINQRSVAAEARLAVLAHLKANGRRTAAVAKERRTVV